MQAGIFNVVAVTGGGDGGHVADVLDHGSQAQRDDGDGGSQQLVRVDVAGGKEAEDGLLHLDGQGEPLGFGDVLNKVVTDGRVSDDRDDVGTDNAEEDRDDLDHALAPDVGGDDDSDSNNGDPPVASAVIDGGGGQGQADGDDDGAGDDGREEAHDLLRAEELEEERQNQIYKTRHGDAEAGVGQRDVLSGSGDQAVSTQECEGGAEECGNLPSGDQVEQQRAETGKEQGGGYVQSGDCGNQNRCTEHCEQVL